MAPKFHRHASTKDLRLVRPLLDDIPSDEEQTPTPPSRGSWTTATRIMRLAVLLQWWMGFPAKWLAQLVRMMLYVLILLPTLVPHLIRYLRDPRIVKSIPYGPKFRHQLDVYLPASAHKYVEGNGESPKLPVVVFVAGGAWIIGYKYWSHLLGFDMMDNDVIMVGPDYRNFPEVSCSNMLSDVETALDWVTDNIEEFGGDPNNITLMGQSAGAHLTLTLLILSVKGAHGTHSPIQRFIGVSGPFDLSVIVPTMHQRGLHRRVVTRGLFENDVDKFDPIKLLSSLSTSELAKLPKEIHLWHGGKDITCPWQVMYSCADALRDHPNVQSKLFENDTHTSLILENPLQGKHEVTNMLLDMLRPNASAAQRVRLKTRFAFLAKIGSYVIPF